MKKLLLMITLMSSTCSHGATNSSSSNPLEFIPSGYVLFDKFQGDLNKDKQEDYVFIIKGTDKNNIIHDAQKGELDRNPRGIIIALKNGNKYDLAAKNLDCFSSENEDGGVYYPPDLNININKGNLSIDYSHGRYGFWSYIFRYQHSKFELIGYEASQDHGPVIDRTISINFNTKKMRTEENTNLNADGGDEQFKESWTKIDVTKLINLEEIKSFDELGSESLLKTVSPHLE